MVNDFTFMLRSCYDGICYENWIIMCVLPANEIWCYTVTPSLIGWVHTQIDPRENATFHNSIVCD